MVQNNFNAATQMVKVYSPEGAELEIGRLNAVDLVRHNGYTWRKSDASIAALAAAQVPAKEEPAAPVEEPKAAEPKAEAAPSLDPATAPLSDLAEQINGDSDVTAYLDGFTADALRDVAEQRYGEKIHRRTGKEKVIEKIVELEDAKLAEESE